MVARAWHGSVKREDADRYFEYLACTGVRDLRTTPGNRGVYVLRRLDSDAAHFLLISLWRSRADIKAFAGEDVERARYYPEDSVFLLELAPRVTHYEVLTGHELFSGGLGKGRES